MIKSKISGLAKKGKKDSVLSKKSAFHTVLLFIISIVILVSLVSACGTANRPTTAKGWLDLGEKYLLDLQYEQAVVAFNKAIEIEPNNVPARIGMAKAYIGLDKPDEAQSVLLEALDIDPENKEAINMLESLPEEQDKITKPSTSTTTLPSETAATEPQPKSLTDAEVAALIEQRIGKFEWYEFGINPLLFEPEPWRYGGWSWYNFGYGYGHGVVSIEPITLKNDQTIYLTIAIHEYPAQVLQVLLPNPSTEEGSEKTHTFNDRGTMMNLTAYLFKEHDGNVFEIEQMRLVNSIDASGGSSVVSIYEYDDQIWLAINNQMLISNLSVATFIDMQITDSGFANKYNIIEQGVHNYIKLYQADFDNWSPKYDYYPVYFLSDHDVDDEDAYNDYLIKFLEYRPEQYVLSGVEDRPICEIQYNDHYYHYYRYHFEDVSYNPDDFLEEITNYAQFGY